MHDHSCQPPPAASVTATATDVGRDVNAVSGSDSGSGAGAGAEPSRAFLGSAYVFGWLVGLALGFYGVFLVPVGPRPGGVLLSVGVAFALAGNTAAALLVRWFTGTRLGAMIVAVGWIPIVLCFGVARPEGDLLLTAGTAGYLFLVVGAIAPVVVAMLGSPRRGLSATLATGPRGSASGPHPDQRPPAQGSDHRRPGR